MRLSQAFFLLLSLAVTIHALAIPASFDDIATASKQLFKRKGGGGGGGKGGGSGGGSSGGGGRASSSSASGGRTSAGSGPPPSFGGGRYYGGGASAPYSAGARSPGGIAPYVIGGAALGIFPGLWLYGAYAYSYPRPYTYHNESNSNNSTNTTLPVTCLCEQYQECGCDNVNDMNYIDSVANNGTVSKVSDVNGTRTLVINGTLPNGTTASGGTDSAAGSLGQKALEHSGLWIVAIGVVYTVWFV